MEIGRYAIQNMPPTNLCPKDMKKVGVVPLVIGAGVPEKEAQQFIELLSRCEDFLGFCYRKMLEDMSMKLNIPCYVLTPPKELITNGCLNCGSALRMHNDRTLATVHVYTVSGPVPASKICW